MTENEVDFIPVASKAELGRGERLVIEVEGNPIVIFNVDDRYYAIDGICSHDEEDLAEGSLDGFELTCPRHGGRFDIRDGSVLALPAYQEVTSYPVELHGDEIVIGLPKAN
jgi:3-phenylpropionate/trans-cinnamate dioxygenase ferredoxin subunit